MTDGPEPEPPQPDGIAPLVSVVIACWNAAGFIDRAISSALAQEGAGPIEVLVVDDQSTDDSVAVVERLAAGEPRLRLLRNARNLGPGGTRNAGIAAARGAWVAILDADDAFAPGRLARLLAVAEAEGASVIADLPILYDMAAGAVAPTQLPAAGGVRRLAEADLMLPDPGSGLDLGLMKPLFRRVLAEKGLWRYGDIRHGEDFALYLDVIAAGEGFYLLEEAYYLYSTRFGELSGCFSPGSVTDVDYTAIVRQSELLARRHAGRPELASLLLARAERTKAQNRVYGWTLLRRREWRRLKRWLAKDGANGRELARILTAKLLGHRGSVAGWNP